MGHKIFIYRDARGNITAREVTEVSESEEYIQCICLNANELRTFRKDRVLEYVNESNQVEARLAFHIENNPGPKPDSSVSPRRKNLEGKLEVCFTGFKKADKDELSRIAEAENLFVRSSVTKGLHLLCCGAKAGHTKMKASRHQGVLILSEAQFRQMLETGEVPEET